LSKPQRQQAARNLLESLRSNDGRGITQATLYFRYYIHRALVSAGYGDQYLEWLGLWRDALSIGLTTWPEVPGETRSDCHGWGAHPTREILAVVLGVESAGPGFREVSITPHIGGLKSISGIVPHPRGEMVVRLEKVKKGLDVEITLPPGVPGLIRFNNKKYPVKDHFHSVI
jgi:hypothetical protein